MAVEHSTLTTTDLHEPKGVAAANLGEVYIADGAGSGTWTKQYIGVVVQTTIADISTASSSWVAAPIAGTIDLIQTIIDAAITSGDATITAEINGTLITGSSITIATAGSAAGDVDSSAPSAAKTVAVGDKIEIITDGTSVTASKAVVNIHITPT